MQHLKCLLLGFENGYAIYQRFSRRTMEIWEQLILSVVTYSRGFHPATFQRRQTPCSVYYSQNSIAVHR